ncbi:2-isopropylmalate synthase [Nanchangia anserum]|uniref:2-isopropylmalate synthase n=1 Tax=Nanchangia anserum TaxID=2692125 RepID=A0A8I0G775_9ACTO|nr:2-isopropylmalate synthase [Nanchangia anserum]MBD3689087.1 2-isopropylmalate synthase [Nanchangia anserum]QOX81325.1 2-isopropylmalate synthase [Nanchangia anserum]
MRTTGKAPVQQPSAMPVKKYRPYWETMTFDYPERTWPSVNVTRAPRWLSTDLRDGNQALIEPMDPVRKRKMFDLLVAIGIKEIEIGFPAASQTDFDFVRSLVEDDAVPDDVCVSVLTQARPDLIARTVEAIKGFPWANVHIYNATSPVFREVVFHNDKAATVELARAGVTEVMVQAEKILGDDQVFGLQYSPEIFTDTERDFALEVCENVMELWQPDDDREIILNLPATVERYTPNSYADLIEWMSDHLSHRDHVVLSAHPHNDRGTGIAAAELAMKAGVDRVEGCLLGQGERTGNVDLLVLAMNLYSQGIDPMLDLSDVDGIRDVVEYCTQMDTPVRHPYVGDLVYTSFSGSHQDAIKKGFQARAAKVAAAGGDETTVVWDLPYLAIDPHDIGRTYEAVVRVNSQSGKGGIAYLMSRDHSFELPRRLQAEFSRLIQRHTDGTGGEVASDRLLEIFTDEYLPAPPASGLAPWGRFTLLDSRAESLSEDGTVTVTIDLMDNGAKTTLSGVGNGPIDAFISALGTIGIDAHVLDYAEHAMEAGRDARAAAYVEVEVADQVLWGVGVDPSITRATYRAVISAVNRALR